MRSALLETDWNEEWMALQAQRPAPDDPARWDARARHFRPRETHPYARDFIELADIGAGESVLDMGCGAGSLAIPLARAGHRVIAADFSARMLEMLEEGARDAGVPDLVRALPLAWDDDWDAAGLGPGCVDVALASRSIATSDLRAALSRLTRVARRRCCITLSADAGPRVDGRILQAIGARVAHRGDYVYAFNILVGMGLEPEVRYISSTRRDTFRSADDAVAELSRMLAGGNEDRIGALRAYVDGHLVANPDAGAPGEKGGPQGPFMLDRERVVRWAFLSWDAAGSPDM